MSTPTASCIHPLFLAAGQNADEINCVTFDEEASTWVVQFDDDFTVVVEWSDAPPRLVLQAKVGKPSEHRKARVHEVVLGYNVLWFHTGGARIGREGPDGELLLMVDLNPDGLEAEHLLYTLQQMRSQAHSWSQFVAEPGDDDPAPLVEPIALTRRT